MRSYEDTNRLFVQPSHYDVRVTPQGTVEFWKEQVARRIRPIFDAQRPTALFVGRYQPFHDGHRASIVEGLSRVGQACIAVRDTFGTDEKNPLGFEEVRARIEHALRRSKVAFPLCRSPISHVFYGRDVGYVVERIEVDTSIAAISGTELRRRIAGPDSLNESDRE
jgi:adenylylsulfate kinase